MKKTIFIFLLLISAIPNVSGRSKFVSAPVDLPWKFMLDDGSKTWLFLANGYDVIDKGDTVSFRFSTGNNWMLTAYSSDFSPVNYVTSSLQGRCGQYYELLYTDAISGMHIEFRVEDGKLIRRVYGTTQQEHPVFSMDVRGAQVFYPACFGKKTQTVQCISPSGMFLSEESNEMIGDRSSSPAILTRENGTMELRYHLPVNLQSGSFDVEWFTYVGAADTDELLCVRDMPDGGVVVCGRTMSANFPGMDANDSLSGSYDMVIFRMDSAGQLLWTTIYGGLYYESANGMMVSDSSIYVAGSTNGNDIPLTNAFQTATGGSYDAVIVKLNFDGTIAQSSYFGGMGAEQAYGVDMDSAGKIVIGGSSTSASLPMSASGYQPAGAGAIDGFITVLNDSFAPQWTTFYGGTGSEDVHQLVITPLNKIVMIGGSFSLNFPCTPNAFQPGRLGNCDAYYVVFDMAGNREYATYYGGSSNEDCFGVAGDENGNIYLAGHTASIDFNITGVIFQPNFAGVNDAWITRFDSTGVPVFSTFFGGGMDDKTWGMMRRDGYLYISGVTHSSDLPMNVTAPQDSLWGASDGFVVKFDTAGNYVTSTFLGGTGADDAMALTVNADTMVTVCGITYSNNLQVTPGAYQQAYVASGDGFVLRYKLSEQWSSSAVEPSNGNPGTSIQVMPNPVANGFVNISADFEIGACYLLDVEGRIVAVQQNQSGQNASINCDALIAGVYFLEVLGKDAERVVVRLIIQ